MAVAAGFGVGSGIGIDDARVCGCGVCVAAARQGAAWAWACVHRSNRLLHDGWRRCWQGGDVGVAIDLWWCITLAGLSANIRGNSGATATRWGKFREKRFYECVYVQRLRLEKWWRERDCGRTFFCGCRSVCKDRGGRGILDQLLSFSD